MNNKIAKALREIEPDSAAKERILQKVMNSAENNNKRKKADSMNTNIKWLTAAVAACAVIAGAVILAPNILGNNNQVIISTAPADSTEYVAETQPEIDSAPEPLYYGEYYENNSDTVGYVTIDGTNIRYAVVQADDNEFYLDHSFDKTESKSGWIFADYRNRFNGTDISDNTILYGHNMMTGDYFAELTNYYRQKNTLEFYKAHPLVTFDTRYEKSEWKIFGVVLAHTQEESGEMYPLWDTLEFADESAFNEYIAAIDEQSVLSANVDIQYGDKLLTLSTCFWPLGEGADTRLLIFARKVRLGESSYVNVDNALDKAAPVMFGGGG